ncbi:hypothetical protein ZIOFF_022807 [Zingiber officinale]|uniref:Uncharacterized protein n=1 Tax=Zingiber officinale TaxID=94328 RepID=A0A8J5H9X4_ZINOF|nr:hypothetical protein ZIOFF_022807 [Zingiber officinale]
MVVLVEKLPLHGLSSKSLFDMHDVEFSNLYMFTMHVVVSYFYLAVTADCLLLLVCIVWMAVQIFILATWILLFAAPLLMGALANNFAIQGTCLACKRKFLGSRFQMIRCTGCDNIL